MITTHKIDHAKSTIELDVLVEKAAAFCNYKLSTSLSYTEESDFIEQGNTAPESLVRILRAAEFRWFELES
ncbi:hypothetical protein [Xenorhabdus ehlersii]|uniref:Uncharacterized protein n=1 Tax=Xenorhabdus ehlersii TaxID=290111 RepID=A0A2D0IMJ9_9GAMM|nr:hypothetical protein [Xenorhabdus ehlersii]PHM23009.1 hypothetical protein Xehl_03243 [Xenorhabdus ehlersii]RKE92676.1 hypothetical protein BDE27_0333 [Xenorhabdus ehlersii]